ncbi:hypothetical protein QYM36_015241 [Artemia franciscana]|nr:hypothetical protein QYM36_015241 [Artemia franciscana]
MSILSKALSGQRLIQSGISVRTCIRNGKSLYESGQQQRSLGNNYRSALTRRAAKGRTFKETIMAPAGETAFNIGKASVAGASALGLGALCYYGLGMSSQLGAVDRSLVWPDYVKERVRSTYMYFGGSIALTAASAAAFFRSRMVMNFMLSNTWVSMLGSLALMIGTGMIVRSLPYEEGLGKKQLAWILHSSTIGAVFAPLTLLGGPLLLRAACYTAGVVGGLTTVAVCAPNEKFLTMGGPLAIGLGVVFAASLGSMFLPPTTALGAGLYSLSLYGGLVLFSGFLLYDTQRIIRAAETYPNYGLTRFDPVNA